MAQWQRVCHASTRTGVQIPNTQANAGPLVTPILGRWGEERPQSKLACQTSVQVSSGLSTLYLKEEAESDGGNTQCQPCQPWVSHTKVQTCEPYTSINVCWEWHYLRRIRKCGLAGGSVSMGQTMGFQKLKPGPLCHILLPRVRMYNSQPLLQHRVCLQAMMVRD